MMVTILQLHNNVSDEVPEQFITYIPLSFLHESGKLLLIQDLQQQTLCVLKQVRQILARLHEVQKSYCSHPGRTRSRSRSRHTLLKFSRSLYLDNQLSESIHTWTIGTL